MSATILAALTAARQRIPAAEARLLLGHVLGRSSVWLEMYRDDSLTHVAATSFADLVERRVAGEPVAYLLGTREFYGRDFFVSPAVLIPRPETELLVECGIRKVDDRRKSPWDAHDTPAILDLGTGSGCLAISLALELPHAQISAVDVSTEALAVAHRNAARLGAQVRFFESDWFGGLPLQTFDLIVANPPYVAAGDSHLTAGDLRFEPPGALTDHADGLTAIRRIVGEANDWLNPGGWLLFEHGYDQAQTARELLAAAGFVAIEQQCDLAGIVRVSGGRHSAPSMT